MWVGACAMACGLLSILGNQLWISPEARGYIVLAGGIAERFDFGHDFFLVRPPGYPILLAGVFAVFGELSPRAIQIVQNLMMVMIVVLTAALAWRLTKRNKVAGLAGLFVALNPQGWAFANMIMTEIPFTVVMLLGVWFMLRFYDHHRLVDLATASFLVGISYLFRPIGLCLLVILIGLAFRSVPSTQFGRRALGYRMIGRQLAFASIPAMLLSGSWLTFTTLKANGAGAGFGPTLFGRLVTLDKLDSSTSEHWTEIQSVVAKANARGLLPHEADARREGTVLDSFTLIRGFSYAETCSMMHRASIELLAEHWPRVLARTLAYSGWTILVPDSSFRFVIGGAEGKQLGDGEWVRDPSAEIFSSATYEPMMRPLIGEHGKYLPLRHEPRPLTPLWNSGVKLWHQLASFDTGLRGPLQTPYGIGVVIAVVGMAVGLAGRRRGAWIIPVLAVGLQVVGSAALVGPVPRYAVPVQPLMAVFAAGVLTVVVGSLAGKLPWVSRLGGGAAGEILDPTCRPTTPVAR